MHKLLTSFAAGAALLLGACASTDTVQPVPADRTFVNFSGVCHGSVNSAPLWGTALGWDRFDFSWQNFQPQRGSWNTAYLEKYRRRILAAKAKGVKFLPILDYGNGWTADGIPEQEFELGGRVYTVNRRPDGDFDVAGYNKEMVNGKPERILIEKRKVSAKRMSQRFVPDDQVADWERFVRKTVAALKAEPYGIEYFQVWNEAHPMSSFWYGDMDAYMKNVHLPAAKIIHELGGKVVYGGWICGESISEFVAYLDRHDAWDSIDVFDLHYFPLAGMEYLARALKERGYEDKGIWQTELGFTAGANFIGNLYPRALHWALENGWDRGDKYKLFYFAYGTPDDPKAYGYRRGLLLGKELNYSGRSLETLAGLLGGAPLELYGPVRSIPVLKPELDERLSSLENFRVGNRIVSTVHMLPNNNAKIFVDWNGDLDTIHIDYENPLLRLKYPELDPACVAKIERVSMYGTRIDLTDRLEKDGNGSAVNVPIREPDRKEFHYTDMPENFLPEVFYTVITLKGE